jgi:hypothetical protein
MDFAILDLKDDYDGLNGLYLQVNQLAGSALKASKALFKLRDKMIDVDLVD